MLEERDARIAVLEAALEPFANFARHVDTIGAQKPVLHVDDESVVSIAINTQWGTFLPFKAFRRAAAAYPTHSEGGEADKTRERSGPHIMQPLSDERSAAALRSQAEANVLAVRSWDSPAFEACVTAEMEKMKSAPAISPMQVQHANEAWNAQPPDASEEDRMKAALETLAASPFPSALAAQVREKADLAICGIGHLLSHLPDDDNGFSEMKNEDLLYIYAVYVAELMKRDPADPVGVMFAHLTNPAPKGGT